MAAVTTAIGLGLGAASMGFGLFNSYEGNQRAEEGYQMQQQGAQIQSVAAEAQARISRQQADMSVAFADRERVFNEQVALDSLNAAQSSAAINARIVGFEREVEAQRRQAMELDARRRQTEIIRNQQRARSLALTNATAQGAAFGSGLQGGYGQISGQSGFNLLGVTQNLQIGRNIFDLNSQITDQRQQYADLESFYALQRYTSQNAKSQMMFEYAQQNAAYQNAFTSAGTLMSQGQGFINQGSGMVGQGQGQMSLGQSFMQAGPQLFSMGANLSTVGPSLFGGGSSPINMFGAAGPNHPVPTYF